MSSFSTRIAEALQRAGERGVRIAVGPAGVDLETQILRQRVLEGDTVTAEGPYHLEQPAGCIDPGMPDGTSSLRYFLDGVQTTREIGRIGAAPIHITTVAAAIVHRRGRRFSRLDLENPPTVVRAVILPRGIHNGQVEEFYISLLQAGLSELGHDEAPAYPDLVLDSTQYVDPTGNTPAVDPSDYIGMQKIAFNRVRSLRERLEAELLHQWETAGDVAGEDWIAVDGQLRAQTPQALGLIKTVANPVFKGDEVNMLLDLKPGLRTTSFIPDWQFKRNLHDQQTSWYLRMWPPQPGTSPLSSLMRIEAPRGISPEQVNEISRWVLAERAPIAKPDPRWAAMIYPIYYVEKVLKPLIYGSGQRDYLRLQRQIVTLANGRN